VNCRFKPGDLVRYKYYTGSGSARATGILLGPCKPPSMWYTVIMPWGEVDCPSHALEVLSEPG